MKIIIRIVLAGLALSGPVQASEIGPDVFKARRDALMESLGGGVAVLYGSSGAASIVRSGFVQESNFYYLTGISEPGAVLVLAPGEVRYKEVLYLQPRNPEVEDWDGRREPLGDALEEATGFDEIARTTALPAPHTRNLNPRKKAVNM